MRRTIGHFALCALARINGTSPVDYLPEEPKRNAVRRMTREVLVSSVGCWESVLDVVNSSL